MKDNWEEAKLIELVIGKGEYGLNAAACEYNPNLNTYLRITDISIDGRFIEEGKKSVNHPDANNYFLESGDIVFARTGASTGKTYLFNSTSRKLVFAGFLIRFKPNPNKLEPYFLKFVTQSLFYKNWVSIYSARTGQPGLNGNEFGDFNFKVPPLPQQQKIAQILSTCDMVLEKTESAIAKYQALKQGLLHDLFTRGIDTKTGQLRPAYSEAPELYKETELGFVPKEWEVEELGDFLFLKSGEGITSEDIFTFERFPVYGGNGLRGYTNSFTHDGEYVLIGRQGALCGNITLAKGKFYASEHAVIVTIINDCNAKWVEYKLRSMNLNQYSEASAQPGLSVGKINKLLIKVPMGEEQNMIAERFYSLENKIHTEQQTLAKYGTLKAGLMQDLLSGKVGVEGLLEKEV